MADDEDFDDAEYEDDEYEDGSFEDDDDVEFENNEEEEVDPDFDDAAFNDDDADFGDDGGDGWDDDDEEITEQQYIPIEEIKSAEDSDEQFELDKDGNIMISPRSTLKRQKSLGLECWTCHLCKATNS